MFAAAGFLDSAVFCLAILIVIVGVAAKVYMAVFRTDDWIKYERHEEEMKQQRAERMKKLGTGGIGILAKLFGKK